MIYSRRLATHLSSFAFAVCITSSLAAQSVTSTTFTYQGHLKAEDDAVAGPHDFRLRLYDAATAGQQVGGQIERTGVAVTNGLFSLPLDFGAAFDGNARWLEVEVKAPGVGSYTTLAPRQAVTAAPQSIFAQQADSATSALNGVPTGFSIMGNSTTPPAGFTWTGETLGVHPQWTTMTNVPFAVENSWGLAVGQKLYAAFGQTLAVYDAPTNKWTQTTKPIPRPAGASYSVATLDGFIFVMGGPAGYETRVDVYDPQTNLWTQIASLNQGLSTPGRVAAVDGTLHYVNGAHHEVYNAGLGRWFAVDAPPVNGSFYVVGMGPKLYLFDQINLLGFVYDTTLPTDPGGGGGTGTSRWSPIAPLPSVRSGYQPVVLDGKIHLLGGNKSSIYYDHHDIYDPETDTWSTGLKLPLARHGYAAGVIGNEILVVGGTPTASAMIKYQPEAPRFFVHSKD